MKIKKISSVLLAVVMILSCFTSAIPAFAADNASSVKNLIDSFSGDMTSAEPEQEALTAYNNMVTSFNSLSKEEKDNFDVYSFDKLLLSVYDREMALWKKENNSTSAANAYKAAHERAKAIINMPSYVDEAIALYTEANGISSMEKADAFIETLKNASKNAVILSGGYYNSYKLFRYSISEKYGAELIDLAADKISTLTQKSDEANKPASPKYVSKPNASKFEGGESNPEYISAYKAYLQYKEDYADYYVDRYAFEGEKHYLTALKKVTDASPDFSYIYDIAVVSLEARRNYILNGDTTKIADAVALYNTLPDVKKAYIETADNYIFAEKTVSSENDLGVEYGYAYHKISGLVDFCKSMELYYTVKDFENLVASVEAPYTNKDIADVKEAYNKIPKTLQNLVASETTVKYKEILASIGPDEPSEVNPDLNMYPSTEVSYKGLSEKNAATLANATTELVLKATGVSNTEELVNTKILTNNMVVTLAGMLYPLLDKETNGLISATPASLAKKLDEEKFAGAVIALNAASEDWNSVTVKSGDFGFEDGDAEGFLDAVSAMLRGASLIHIAIKLENTKNTAQGTYTYGAYEELIEVFEILDLNKVMSSDEYTNYVNSAKEKDDAKFRAILAPIVDLIVAFGNDPVNTICDVLPKLAYAIDSGIVDNRINNLISKISLVSIPPVDLTTVGIYNILNKELLTANNISLSEEEFCSLIKEIAGCGTAVTKESVQRGQKYRMGIESDRAKTIVVLMSWILDVAENNKELVDSLLDMLLGDSPFLKFALKLLINTSTKFIPRKIIFVLASIFINIANVFSSLFNLKF